MKKILILLVGLGGLSTAYADLTKLYISNDSEYPITIETNDGKQVALEKKTRITNVEVVDFSEVKNYIKNKYVCSWYLNAHPLPNHELVGLTLTERFQCKLDYTQGP